MNEKEGNKTLKSLIVDHKGRLSIQELPMPKMDDYKALVKMESCGVCNGTDMKLIHRNFKNFDTYPAVLGHEGVGRVVEKGKLVTGFEIGDLVLLPFLEEKEGEYYPGWGAFSEYAVVGDAKAMIRDGKGPGTPYFSESYFVQQVIPESVDPVGAAMIITFREVLSAMKRFGMGANKSLVVFGAGPVGMCFIKFAKLLGMGPVISFDVVDEKVKDALNIGADYAFNSTKHDVPGAVKDILPDLADFVVDAVGMNQLINQAMSLIKYNGKICCYGISPKLNMDLDWSQAPYNWSLDFVQWPSKKEESEAHSQIISWVQLGVLDPNDFISHVIPFDHVINAFEMVENREATKKIIIKF